MALGCSSNSFDIAETPDTGDAEVVDSAVVTNDTSSVDSNAPPADVTVEDVPINDTGRPVLDTAGVDTSSPPVDAGPVTGSPCARGSDCSVYDFCKFAKCGDATGLCTKLPAITSVYGPVCACNGVTFWNQGHAFATSTAIAHEGICGVTERLSCTGAGTACGGYTDGKCVVQLNEYAECSMTPKYGNCWRMPAGKLCGPDAGAPVLSCTTTLCLSQCEAAKSLSVPFYPASCTTT